METIIINAEKDRKINTIKKNIKNGIKGLNLLITDEWKAYKVIAVEKSLPHLIIEHKYEWYGRKMVNIKQGKSF